MGLRERWNDYRLQRELLRRRERTPGTALVTGANKGIGYEVVRQLAAKGWRVFLTARDREKGAAAAATLGDRVRFIQMDVSDEASIAKAAQDVSAQTDSLDLLINNAGVLFRDQDRSILDVRVDILQQCWAINCVGALLVTRAFLPLLRKSAAACVVNVSSEMGRLYPDHHEVPAYSISKTALNAVTKRLALACKPDRIPVNAICPGHVKSDMGGPHAPRTVENGAGMIVWLGTEVSRGITGRFIEDGMILRW